jgi:hypothetical protein
MTVTPTLGRLLHQPESSLHCEELCLDVGNNLQTKFRPIVTLEIV